MTKCENAECQDLSNLYYKRCISHMGPSRVALCETRHCRNIVHFSSIFCSHHKKICNYLSYSLNAATISQLIRTTYEIIERHTK